VPGQEWTALAASFRLRNQSKKIAELKAAVQAPGLDPGVRGPNLGMLSSPCPVASRDVVVSASSWLKSLGPVILRAIRGRHRLRGSSCGGGAGPLGASCWGRVCSPVLHSRGLEALCENMGSTGRDEFLKELGEKTDKQGLVNLLVRAQIECERAKERARAAEAAGDPGRPPDGARCTQSGQVSTVSTASPVSTGLAVVGRLAPAGREGRRARVTLALLVLRTPCESRRRGGLAASPSRPP
jgi:hypothetical protein